MIGLKVGRKQKSQWKRRKQHDSDRAQYERKNTNDSDKRSVPERNHYEMEQKGKDGKEYDIKENSRFRVD